MPNSKLKLSGVKNIAYYDSEPEAGKEYLLALIVERISVEEIDDEEPTKVYKMKVLRPEMMQEVGEARVRKIEKGFTPSQRLRAAIRDYLRRTGREDSEENYEEVMEKLIKFINEKE